MTQDLKSTFEPHQAYAERQRTKRLKDSRKARFFASIEDYNAWADQPDNDNGKPVLGEQ
jgi:hypothetical protein